jgi:hypothetical protein
MDNVGSPIKEVIDILDHHALRDRIEVIASGKLVTPLTPPSSERSMVVKYLHKSASSPPA